MYAISLNAVSKKLEASAIKLQKLYGQTGDESLMHLAEHAWQIHHSVKLKAMKRAADKTV